MPNWKKVIVSGSDATLTSVTATAGFTGSLQGTASYATNALSASYAPDTTFPYTGSALITGSLGITGSLSNGTGNIASGIFSHAEGLNTTATGNWSHAEGSSTTATGKWSHAEGNSTTATGEYSHAEGYNTTANGQASHAEGSSTTATGDYSHAEGASTTVRGQYSHAEGERTNANGQYSHAEGASTTATGDYSHAEGESTTATGANSHAEGASTTAIGDYSHAEGEGTTATGANSHAEGASTQTGTQLAYDSGISSGIVTINSSYDDVSGDFSANDTLLIYDDPFDANYGKITTQISQSLFNGTNTIVELYDISITTTQAYVGDITQGILNWTGNQTIPGAYSHAEGGGTTAIGEASHAEGASTTAIGAVSHAEGYGTTATGVASHAEGEGTTATGNSSHAEGASTTAIGDYSHAEGAGTTAGQLGYGAETSITSGVFELSSGYGNLTSSFSPGVFVLIDDDSGQINGTPNIFKLEVSSTTYTGTPATQITLVDTSINTSNTKYRVGIYGNFNPPLANVSIGSHSHTSGESTHTVGVGSSTEGANTEALGYYSHAEGYGTTATGNSSHAEGLFTVASGQYQHVQGQYNISSSAQSAFIVGNGTADGSRSNLIFASGSQVQITGSAIISGSLEITGSVLVQDINGKTNIDSFDRKLYDAGPAMPPGASSVLSIDWGSRTLNDSSGVSAIAWRDRALYTPNATTAIIWSDNTYLSSDVYQRDYKSAATQDAVSTNSAAYLGDVIESDGSATVIDAAVTEGMLVYLDTNTTWYPVDQANTRASYLLGIAHNLASLPPPPIGPTNQTGWILLEGHVVIDDTAQTGPYVAGADHGLPIYIEDSTTTGTMSTTVPTSTGGPNVVRVLGHCYQQNTTTTTQWMMKFRPSNDWVEI
jgi:hypothetical protein